ncbi:hypothetical protein GOP47_0009223 [Adiantum capillus-veneris]|uniref:Uncharacterized protein n=1 Tax=Adiantum capillus-veneris TaxID=13818 RepID=A0A9D4UXE6_ADICA|nr:hypothetical protein GOP47_0009223 [Adiantum capillus-veneris]
MWTIRWSMQLVARRRDCRRESWGRQGAGQGSYIEEGGGSEVSAVQEMMALLRGCRAAICFRRAALGTLNMTGQG